VLLAIAFTGASAEAARPDDLGQLRTLALDLVNEEREVHDLPPLRIDSELSEAAQRHAEDMLNRGYYAHESPEGSTALDRYVRAGGSRWKVVAENIARCENCGERSMEGTVEAFQHSWMSSAEHREAILASRMTDFGFGIAGGDGRWYAVQTFAGAGAPAAGQATREEAAPLSSEEQERLALELVNRARRDRGIPALQASAGLSSTAGALLGERFKEGSKPLDLSDADLSEALPRSEKHSWQAIAALAAECGGCGVRPTDADVEYFRDEFMEKQQYRRRLLDPSITHLGFAIRADGKGRKAAIGVLGARP
jgi:uncharacterized protein YkwD